MKKSIRFSFSFLIVCFLLVFAGCSALSAPQKNVCIVNWNAQCFFDATTEGPEYKEFKKNQKWNKTAYEVRLERLCAAIKKMKADIYVLEEIENQAVLVDISNRLQDCSWNQAKGWNYATFCKNPGDSIGCAVISRLPILSVTVHNLDIKTEKSRQPAMRPIMKTTVQTGDESLTILVNHWKSKSGGAQESETWRNWQEALLSNLFEESLSQKEKVIACGDFNRDIEEFFRDGNDIILRKKNEIAFKSDSNADDFSRGDGVRLKNPWIKEDGNLVFPGSYYFRERFERIDHFFIPENICLLQFAPQLGEWASEEGIPKRYEIFSGQGFSDHLPVMCVIKI